MCCLKRNQQHLAIRIFNLQSFINDINNKAYNNLKESIWDMEVMFHGEDAICLESLVLHLGPSLSRDRWNKSGLSSWDRLRVEYLMRSSLRWRSGIQTCGYSNGKCSRRSTWRGLGLFKQPCPGPTVAPAFSVCQA